LFLSSYGTIFKIFIQSKLPTGRWGASTLKRTFCFAPDRASRRRAPHPPAQHNPKAGAAQQDSQQDQYGGITARCVVNKAIVRISL